MRAVAFAVGSYGDVEPFIVLGERMQKRGHRFSIAAFPEFEQRIRDSGLGYYKMHGSLEQMLRMLLSDSDNSRESGINGLRYFYKDTEKIFACYENACRDADLILYMQFGDLAYHFAEKYGIPCVRSYVYPSDPTRQFSALMSRAEENSILTKWSYLLCDYFMYSAKKECIAGIRRRLGLYGRPWLLGDKRQGGKRMLTLYQYSESLAPKDPGWNRMIKVTGPWYSDEQADTFEPSGELAAFLESGEPPVYIGFGSMNYSRMDELASVIHQALKRSGIRAVVAENLNAGGKFRSDGQIFYTGFIPFQWLFPRIRGVVQHGGSGTVHYSLRNGIPTLVLAFGADQYFWGRRVHAAGCGPYPLDVKTDEITVGLLVQKLRELTEPEKAKNAEMIRRKMAADPGVEGACGLLEKYYQNRRKQRNGR